MGAIILEVAGTLMLPLTQNFSKPIPTVALAVLLTTSFYLLTHCGEGYTFVGGLCYVEWSRRVLSSHYVLRPLWRLTQVASNSWFISNYWRCGIGQHL
jgi:hypothetical protein